MSTPIIRIKDSFGNVIPIPALRGPRGDLTSKQKSVNQAGTTYHQICFSDNNAYCCGSFSASLSGSSCISSMQNKNIYELLFTANLTFENAFTDIDAVYLGYEPAANDPDIFLGGTASFDLAETSVKATFIRESAREGDEVLGKFTFIIFGKADFQNFA